MPISGRFAITWRRSSPPISSTASPKNSMPRFPSSISKSSIAITSRRSRCFPLVGTKRGVPAVNTPAENFTLAEIETPEGVKRPPIYPDAMAQLIHWKYDGNPYYGNQALKMRAFVIMCVNLVMLDEQLEHAPELGGSRTDWLAPSVLQLAFPYRS